MIYKPITFFISFLISVMLISGCDTTQVAEEVQDEQFVQILYKYSFRNELNTYEGYYQKDLVADGTIKIEFWLDSLDQQAILEKALEIGFFDFPDEFINDSEIEVSPNPLSILKIRRGEDEHQTEWRFIPFEFASEEYVKVRELAGLIRTIIESNSKYKELPEPNGGYD